MTKVENILKICDDYNKINNVDFLKIYLIEFKFSKKNLTQLA